MLDNLEDNLDEVITHLNTDSHHILADRRKQQTYRRLFCEKLHIQPLSHQHRVVLLQTDHVKQEVDYVISLAVIDEIERRRRCHASATEVVSPLGGTRELELARCIVALRLIVGNDILAATPSCILFGSDHPVPVEYQSCDGAVISSDEIKCKDVAHRPFGHTKNAIDVIPVLVHLARRSADSMLIQKCLDHATANLLIGKGSNDLESLTHRDWRRLIMDCRAVVSIHKLITSFFAITDPRNEYRDKTDVVKYTLAQIFLQVARCEEGMGAVLLTNELSKFVVASTGSFDVVEALRHDACKFTEACRLLLAGQPPDWWPYLHHVDHDSYMGLMQAKDASPCAVMGMHLYLYNRSVRKLISRRSIAVSSARWFALTTAQRKMIEDFVRSDEVVDFVERQARSIFAFDLDKPNFVSLVYKRFVALVD